MNYTFVINVFIDVPLLDLLESGLIKNFSPPQIKEIPFRIQRIDPDDSGSDGLTCRIRIGAPHGYKEFCAFRSNNRDRLGGDTPA